MDEVVGLVLTTLIQVLAPLVLTFLIQWIVSQLRLTKAQISAESFKAAREIVGTLVSAAEQSGLAGVLSSIGEEKKAWVMAAAQEEFIKRGIKIDIWALETIIEAAVYDQITMYKDELAEIFET